MPIPPVAYRLNIHWVQTTAAQREFASTFGLSPDGTRVVTHNDQENDHGDTHTFSELPTNEFLVDGQRLTLPLMSFYPRNTPWLAPGSP